MTVPAMDSPDISPPLRNAAHPPGEAGKPDTASPAELGLHEFSSYSLVIDARSPHEYAEDHLPGAINLPVVDDEEYAEVGIQHKTDKHAAYLIGVEYSLRNIANQIKPLISRYGSDDRFLVYCFRGGKRSRLWADNLRTIGFEVDQLAGGWKRYRQWVRDSLATLPQQFRYQVLAGPTGCGKTRLLAELARQGEQVIDLEELASHRGSLLGDLPGRSQPSQKLFDSMLLAEMRKLDPARPVWIEAESKKIGDRQIPDALYEAMHRSPVTRLSAPMSERVRLWREDYVHFADDPVGMVEKLLPLKPLVGGEVVSSWQALASEGRVESLFESVMVRHYDPCYARSTRKNYGADVSHCDFELPGLDADALRTAARRLIDTNPEGQ